MKTKPELIEELVQVIIAQELQNIQTMDVLNEALDYINSSEDKRAKMNDFFENEVER